MLNSGFISDAGKEVARKRRIKNSTPDDPAEGILRADQTLTDEHRAALWDIWHGTRDHNELASQLQPLAIADDTKAALYNAKQSAHEAAKCGPSATSTHRAEDSG